VIDDFKTGTVDVLTNYGVLSTGFDVPKVDVIFIVRPTASIVLYSQMIGRGLRGPAIGGTPYCRIVDVKDNIEGYEDADAVYEYFEEYWN
jgi:superfamily II DNA or RNA helicase